MLFCEINGGRRQRLEGWELLKRFYVKVNSVSPLILHTLYPHFGGIYLQIVMCGGDQEVG